MADFDVAGTVADLIAAIRGELKEGWNKVSALVEQQSEMMAQQAEWIALSSAPGGALSKNPKLRQLFADQLADSVRFLARDIASHTILTAEIAWNAAVSVLWGAINKFLSSASSGLLVLPTF